MIIYSRYFPSEIFDYHFNNDEYLKNIPITIFNDYIGTQKEFNQNPYNILILTEPNEVTNLYEVVKNNHHHFSYILTWDSDLLKHCPNSILNVYGLTSRFCRPWDETYSIPEYRQPPNINYNKNYEVSFLCGEKQLLPGHKLRHNIFNNKENINIPNHILYSTHDKTFWENGKDRCWDSMFHIAVENTKHDNYFTEKIIDAFLTKTIPIYWGCSNIHEYFNKDGILTFETKEELFDIINNLTPEFYYSKLEIINENYNMALTYANYVERLKQLLIQICKFNNI